MRDGKIERTVKITFDEFLKPAIKAKKARLPYRRLVLDLPDYEIDLISTWTNLPRVHLHISPFAVGWSSDSDREVEVVNDSLEELEDKDDEIMMVLGYPFFPFGQE